MKKALSLLFGMVLGQGSEPNPPTWKNNVKLFKPDGDMSAYQSEISDIHKIQGGIGPDANVPGQWAWTRYALLFMPGTYDLKVEVGFYTSVAGLGRLP